MGASMSWLVCDVEHTNRLKVLLKAHETKQGQQPSLCVSTTSENKLFLFEARGRDWNFHTERERKRLSKGREVYFCVLEEHVMYSEVSLWRNGDEIWCVIHNSELGIYHLHTRGQLPTSFASHKEARIAEQNADGGQDSDVDYIISVPLDLAKEFTGYDGGIDQPEDNYTEWTCAKRGLLGRLFGK